ncbi:hypothetical protein LRB11_15920, partial [Ectothiorhodospira haloalkaliphila]|uniref:hypothetical protein n=1 Tax=Ectothiorhodospira haloalkaliphila TaxID=421628 RepID=UPI001EE79EB3
GELTLIDKALGLEDLRAQLEAQTQHPLSRSELARQLADLGYTLSRRHLRRFEYAARILSPLIPEALRNGMGQPQIDGLRTQEQAFQTLWTQAGEAPDLFDGIWSDVLTDLDGPDFDVELVREGMENRLATLLERPLTHIRLEVDALIAGRRLMGEPQEPVPDTQDQPIAPPEAASPDLAQSAPATEEAPSPGDPPDPPMALQGLEAASGEDQEQTSQSDGDGDGDGDGQEDSETAYSAPPRPNPSMPTDLKSLRSRNYVLSLQLAQRHGLGDCIRPYRLGLGFLVDFPAEAVDPGVPDDSLSHWIWWFLFVLSEFHADQDRAAHLIEHELTDYLSVDPDAQARVRTPDWTRLGNELLSSPRLAERDIQILHQLLHSCRQTRQQARDPSGNSLWPPDGEHES